MLLFDLPTAQEEIPRSQRIPRRPGIGNRCCSKADLEERRGGFIFAGSPGRLGAGLPEDEHCMWAARGSLERQRAAASLQEYDVRAGFPFLARV